MHATKRCNECGRERAWEDFPLASSMSGRRKKCCIDCEPVVVQRALDRHRDRERQRRRTNPQVVSAQVTRSRWLKRYGLTVEQYAEMHASQKGRCLMCGLKRTLFVDHCHKTGRVRGLLCNGCNLLLGRVEQAQDAGLLDRALAMVSGELKTAIPVG